MSRARWTVLILLVIIAISASTATCLLYANAKAQRARDEQLAAQLALLTAELRGFREWVKVAEAESRKPRQWEYRIEAPDDYRFDTRMAEYGRDGWELVAARRASSGGVMAYEMIFKRPKP